MTSVTFVTGSLTRKAGGLFVSVRRLAQCLGELNMRIHVVGLADEFLESDLEAWRPLQPVTLSTKGPRSFGYSSDLQPKLLELAADVEHVHGLWMYPSIANLAWSRRTRKPYLISPRGMLDSWALSNSKWRKALAGRLFENRHLGNAACLHALCRSEADSIRRYGLKNPICVISNGVDLPERADDRGRTTEDGRQKTDDRGWKSGGEEATTDNGRLTTDKKVLLFLGRIHPKKGLANLLSAWSKTCLDKPELAREWTLVVAGWDQAGHEEELKRMSMDVGMGRNVHFVGPVFGRAKDDWYRRSSAFVLPSYSEGLPMAVLEAWSYGMPVVMTPRCNIQEGFAANAAVPIDPEPDSIRRGLAHLLEMSPDQRAKMGQNGLRLVTDKFSWRIVAQQMKAVYDWVLGGGSPPDSVRMN
jgi:glycosyltransferase involved in cell wall biosynthesis